MMIMEFMVVFPLMETLSMCTRNNKLYLPLSK
jgi:hypothetical protein